METTRSIQKSAGMKMNLFTKTKQDHNGNPLFENDQRSMSGGDYINIHQRRTTMSCSRFSWLMPDED